MLPSICLILFLFSCFAECWAWKLQCAGWAILTNSKGFSTGTFPVIYGQVRSRGMPAAFQLPGIDQLSMLSAALKQQQLYQ
jgi:hypothetical protein